MRHTLISPNASAIALAVGVFSAGFLPLNAATIDLTTMNSSGSLANGGSFQQIQPQSTGTGVIDPFVRLQGGDVVEGYNATARPLMGDVNTSPTFTHDIQFSSLLPAAISPINGVLSVKFMLDINQTGADPLISLHELQIYTRATPITDANSLADLTSTATLRYDLDSGGDSNILLDFSLNSGSGSGDMFAYIPLAAFGATLPTDYVYLYSAFGLPSPFNNNDGFEEWAAVTGTTINAPDGGTTVLLLGGALMFLAVIQRRVFC